MANVIDTTILEKFIGCSPGQLTQLIRDFVEAPGTNKIKETLINNNLEVIYNQLQLDRGNKTNKKKIVVINEFLTYDEECLLKNAYPEFDISFVARVANSHAFAAASRRCETELLLLHAEGNERIIDIGGNFYYHFRNGSTNVHCDCPLITVRDSQRWSTRVAQVIKMSQNLTREQFDIYHDIRCVIESDKSRPSLCRSKFHECEYKATCAISVHSLYDIPIEEIMTGMIRRGINVLYASLVFSSQILVQRKGVIDGIKAHYEWDLAKDIITFAFENDSSLVYRHKFKNYLRYFINPHLRRSYNGTESDFVIELLENRNGIQFLKITRCVPCRVFDDSSLIVRHWLSCVKNKKILKYFEFDHNNDVSWSDVFYNICRGTEMRAVYFFVDSELVERGMDFAYRATDKFKPLEIYNYMQSLNRRMFVGGREVMHREAKERAEVLYRAANVIYLEVFSSKYDIGQILSDLKAGVEHNRKLASCSLIGKFFSKTKQCLRESDPRYSSGGIVANFVASLHRKLYDMRRCKVPDMEDFSRFATVPLDKLAAGYERSSLSRLIFDPAEYLEYDAAVAQWMGYLKSWLNSDDRLVFAEMPAANPAPMDLLVATRDIAIANLLTRSRALADDVVVEPAPELLRFGVLDLRDFKFTSSPNPAYRSQYFEEKEYTICPISASGDCQLRSFARAFRSRLDAVTLIKIIEKLRSTEAFSCCGDVLDEVLIALRAGKAPSLNLLCLLTQIFPVSFIIHSEIDRNYYLVGTRQECEVHLLLRHSHVDLLLPRANEYNFDFDLDSHVCTLLLGPLYRPLRVRIKSKLEFIFSKLREALRVILGCLKIQFNLFKSGLSRLLDFIATRFARFSFSKNFLKLFDPLRDLWSRLSGEDEALRRWVDDINERILSRDFEFCETTDAVHEVMLDAVSNGVGDFESSDHGLGDLVLSLSLGRHEAGVELSARFDTIDDEYETAGELSDVCDTVAAVETLQHDGLVTAVCIAPCICSDSRVVQLYNLKENFEKFEQYNLDFDPYRNYSKLRCFYDRSAYELYAILHDSRLRGYFAMCRGQLVVDIGGAPGGFLQVLTCSGYRVYSVSSGEYRVAQGERHIGHFASRDYPSASILIINMLAEGVLGADLDQVLSLARRVLNVGGFLLLKHENFFSFSEPSLFRKMFRGFSKLYILKPAFSPMNSPEFYIFAINYGDDVAPVVCGYDDIKKIFLNYIEVANEFLHVSTVPRSLTVFEMSANVGLSLAIPNHMYNIRYLNDVDRNLFIGLENSVSYSDGFKIYSLDILREVRPGLDDDRIYVMCGVDVDPSEPISKYFSYLRSYPLGDRLMVCHTRNRESINTVDITKFSCLDKLALTEVYRGSDKVLPWCEFSVDIDKVFHNDYDYHYIMKRNVEIYFCYGSLSVRPRYSFTAEEKCRNFLRYYSSVVGGAESVLRMHYLSVYCCISRYPVGCVDGLNIRTINFDSVAEYYVMLRVSPHNYVERISTASFEVGVGEVDEACVRYLRANLPCGNTLAVTVDEGVDTQVVEQCFSQSFATVYVRKFNDDEHTIDFLTCVVRAIAEVRAMWQARVDAVMKEFRAVYCSLKETKFLGACTLQHIGVVDAISGDWQRRPTVRCDVIPTVGYDGQDILEIKFNKRTRRFEFLTATRSRYIIVSTRVEIFNEPLLLARTARLESLDLARGIGEFIMYAGAPGSGKSTAILSRMDRGSESDVSDICITANRDTVEDLRDRAVSQGYCDTDGYLRSKFRTFESLIINSRDMCSDLWVDEAYMRPPGQVFMCALITGARRVHMYCDFAQIPFINRDRLITMRYNNYNSFSWRIERRSHTYRCPRDVVALINNQKYYPFEITGSNPKTNSMRSAKFITSVVEVPVIKDAHYLTYTQDDKSALKNRGFSDVNTIHEFQGEQNSHIVLVRISAKNYEVHNSSPHLLVAFTRHTDTFEYYTTVHDRMCTLIDTARMLDQHKYFKPLSAGAIGSDGQWELGFPVEYQLELERTVHYEECSKLARAIVSTNAGADVTSVSVTPLYRVDAVVGSGYGTDFGPSLGREYLQMLYDDLFPGASAASRADDQVINEREDASFQECVFVLGGDARNFINEREYMVPYLRTSIQANVQETPQSVIHAFSERNGGVPDYLGEINSDYVEICVECFEKTYIRDFDLYRTFKENPINLNSYMIDDWFRTQKREVFKQVSAADLDLSFYELQAYEFMLKRNPKPLLDVTSTTKISAPQTIAFHKKLVNSVFCPIVREIKKRLMSVLGHNVQVFTDMSVIEFENRLNTFLRPVDLKAFPFTKEIDFSKFDKSQWDNVLFIEIKLLLNLGFPSELVCLWIYMYYHTVLINHTVRFKAIVEYQRKSGSPLTFLGNTFYTMVCIAVVFRNCRDFLGMRKVFLFAGDDVFMFLERHVEVNISDFELIFNLESKLLNYKYYYFCSKFLLPVDDNTWRVVPDPAKLLTKLGRHDLVSYEHVNEYRISVRDMINQMAVSNCLSILEDAMYDRYGLITSWEPFIATMLDLTSSVEKFFALFSDERISFLTRLKRKLHSKMPSLDI
ncbi:MAG: polymerase protein [Apis virga-like virus]|nr:MAG: polymerase protein [Apis virga-like virus]